MVKIKQVMIVSLGLLFTFMAINVYASDWDKAGKALTVIEGIRLVTAGKVDLIGNVFGLNKDSYQKGYHYKRKQASYKKIWVPHYKWVKEYVPEHTEYHPEYGEVIVEGHYIKYQIQDGGHWEFVRR